MLERRAFAVNSVRARQVMGAVGVQRDATNGVMAYGGETVAVQIAT